MNITFQQMEVKVEILPKNDNFIQEFFEFLSEKSIEFRRDFSINNILNKEISLNKIKYLEKNSPIKLDDVYGSTFQSSFRGNDNIYAISHDVISIEIIQGKFFGNIKPSTYGETSKFDVAVLRPVYYKKDDKSEYQIATFDIDFNIMRDSP